MGVGSEYSRIHYAARQVIASTCENCGSGGPLHAALRSTVDPQILRLDPESGCNYSTNVGDYHALCIPCHRRLDLVEGRMNCKNGHLYTPDNTRMKAGARVCRTCHREREARRTADPKIQEAKREAGRVWRQKNPMSPAQKARKVQQQRARRAQQRDERPAA